MAKIESHRDLIVWRKAMDLAVETHRLTSKFPRSEMYGLVSQLTHAAVSVPANIAEGNARGTKKDYANFLAVAKGSLMEAETYFALAIRLKYLNQQEAEPALALIVELSRMLTSMRMRLIAGNGRIDAG